MLFNSIDFFVFLPIVFVLYWFCTLGKRELQNIVLLIASYVFYSWWDYRFLALIIFSSSVDFIIGKAIYKTKKKSKKKMLLWSSIFTNIGLLGFFKYFNFFLESFVSAFTILGAEIHISSLNIILPVGISFYTFQTLSYTIDIYKGKLIPSKKVVPFFTFVSFFPQLVAGPIERAGNLLPQFQTVRVFKADSISYGTKLIIWGFFLKLVVADRAAIYVNAVYNNVESHDGLTFLFATVLFAFQIYGDFAGYSLIAIGTAELFGIKLMTNFRRPYFSASVSEFWSRWHISLSTWFRDYLYIPLGGNRASKPRWLFNLLITFLVSGLWHGANWTFLVWGALNGFYLIFEILLFKKEKRGPFHILVTFALINLSWVFFRASSLNEAFIIVTKIFTTPGSLYIGSGDDIAASIYATGAIVMLLVFELRQEFFTSLKILPLKSSTLVKQISYALLVVVILYLGVFDESQFIYFQF